MSKLRGTQAGFFSKEGKDVILSISEVLMVDVLEEQFRQRALAGHLEGEPAQGVQQVVGPPGC